MSPTIFYLSLHGFDPILSAGCGKRDNFCLPNRVIWTGILVFCTRLMIELHFALNSETVTFFIASISAQQQAALFPHLNLDFAMPLLFHARMQQSCASVP